MSATLDTGRVAALLGGERWAGTGGGQRADGHIPSTCGGGRRTRAPGPTTRSPPWCATPSRPSRATCSSSSPAPPTSGGSASALAGTVPDGVDVRPLFGQLDARRTGPGPRPVAARPASRRAGHRHRRDEPHRRRRADRGRQRSGAQPPLRRPQRPDPAADRAELAGLGRPAGRSGGTHRAGRGLPAVVRGRARPSAGLRPARDRVRRSRRARPRAGPAGGPAAADLAFLDAPPCGRARGGPRAARRPRGPRRPASGHRRRTGDGRPPGAPAARPHGGDLGRPGPGADRLCHGRPARGARRPAGPARGAADGHRRPGAADRRPAVEPSRRRPRGPRSWCGAAPAS